MGSSCSSLFKSGDRAGKEDATFVYDAETRCLSYTDDGVPKKISASNVIAVTKSGPNRHLVLYSDDEGVSESITVGNIRTLQASGLPMDFATDFQARALNFNGSDTPSLHVVLSIASGTRQAETFYSTRLVPVLEALGLTKGNDYTLHLTTSDKTITELTTSVFLPAAVKGVKQTIILLSGDGGMVDIVNATMSSFTAISTPAYTNPTIAILPLGTGNALAHSSKVTSDNTMGLSTLLRGKPSSLPVFRATFSPESQLFAHETAERLPLSDGNSLWGCVVLSWGLHAALVADSDTPEYREHGVQRFQMAAKENLFPSDGSGTHQYLGRLSILTEDGTWETIERKRHAYVLATFVSNLEKTFTISPASKPLDGNLRLVHFGPMGGEEVMSILGQAYQAGKHVEDSRVGYREVKGIRIEFDEDDERWRRVCIDGKIVGVGQGGWVEVRKEDGPQGLDVLCLEGSHK